MGMPALKPMVGRSQGSVTATMYHLAAQQVYLSYTAHPKLNTWELGTSYMLQEKVHQAQGLLF